MGATGSREDRKQHHDDDPRAKIDEVIDAELNREPK